MEFVPYNENDFTNDFFQMKVLLNILDIYVTGMFTKFPNEELEVSVYDFNDDRYYEFEGNRKYIKFYIPLD